MLSTVRKTELAKALEGIDGWFGLAEAKQLSEAVSAFPPLREPLTIVEIGSWKGRSTIALALGLADRAGTVFAIDPHDTTAVDLVSEYGVADTFAEFEANLARAGVSSKVRTMRKTSTEAIDELPRSIDVLFVDGSHRYEDVRADLSRYLPRLAPRSVVAFNDPTLPGVYRALRESVLRGRRDFYDGMVVQNTLFLSRDVSRTRSFADVVQFARLRLLLLLRYLGVKYRDLPPRRFMRSGQRFARWIGGGAALG